MTYTASYVASDLGTILIDFLGYMFAGLAANAAVIVALVIVVIVIGLASGAFKGLGSFLQSVGRIGK